MVTTVSSDYIIITLLGFILVGTLFLVISTYIFLFKKKTKNKLREQILSSEEKIDFSSTSEDSNNEISITSIDFNKNKEKENTFKVKNNIMEKFLKLLPPTSIWYTSQGL